MEVPVRIKNKLTVLNIPQPDTIFKSFYENFAYFDKNSIFQAHPQNAMKYFILYFLVYTRWLF